MLFITFSCFPCTVAPKLTAPSEPIIARVGTAARIEMTYTGIPTPKVTWKKDGSPAIIGMKVKTDVTDTTVIYTLRSCEKSDAGTYTATVTNDAGSDSASVDVMCVDRPGPPQAPLDQSDVTEKSVTLSWRPPASDGGSRIYTYIIEKRTDLDFKWKKVTSQDIKDLTFKVTGLKENKKYQFRVSAENKYGRSETLEGQSVTPMGQYGK